MEKSPFIPPSFVELQAEQTEVQESKCRERLLTEYDAYFFSGELRPGIAERTLDHPTIHGLFRPYCKSEHVNLRDALVGMSDQLIRPVDWVDMGGGRGLAMRQMASNVLARQAVRMTNIDLQDIGLKGLQPDEYRYLENLSESEGITTPRTKPNTIIDNIETVQLNTPADLITSVENMQYLNNPLGALCNWYNQLSDNGFMLIYGEHRWPGPIKFDRVWQDRYNDETLPIHHLLEQFDANNINYASRTLLSWRPEDIYAFAVQKQPGTTLEMNTKVQSVSSYRDYKSVRYTLPGDDQPCIKVAQSTSNSQ